MGVRAWWAALAVVSVANILLWGYSARVFMRRRNEAPHHARERLPHILLSAGYVLGCGFRSVLPRADVQRICLYDSWLSSVFVGRSVATIAELCFAAQWALILREFSKRSHDSWGLRVSSLILPLITIAEISSWYAVLSTNFVFNAIEQSLWTFTAALVGALALRRYLDAEPKLKWFWAASAIVATGFVLFMVTVDVPMYLTRWSADELQGKPYLSLMQGFQDVSSRWVVTHAWEDWHEEIAWMSFYFSFAVWISISLAHAPRAAQRTESAPEPRERASIPAPLNA